MPFSYDPPDADYIKLVTGLNEKIEEESEAALDARLLLLLPAAEAITSARITRALFISSNHTEDKAQLIRDAVTYRVGAFFLRRQAGLVGTGTHADHPMELSDLLDASREWAAVARELELLVMDEKYRERALLEGQS